MFNIQIQSLPSVLCVIPEGRLDTVNSTRFNEQVASLLENEDHLVIDFSHCNYLASSGIRSLMAANKKLVSRGGCLFIAGLQAEVYQVIEMTGLHQVFQITGDVDEAAEKIQKSKKERLVESVIRTETGLYKYRQIESEVHSGLIWRKQGIAGYNELVFAIGLGSPAETLAQPETGTGIFVTTGHCSGFVPFDKGLSSDFRVVNNPSAGGISLDWAVSFNQGPVARICLEGSGFVQLEQLTRDIRQMPASTREAGFYSFLAVDFNPDSPSLSMILVADPLCDLPAKYDIPGSLMAHAFANADGFRVLGVRYLLNNPELMNPDDSLRQFLNNVLVIDNIEGVESVNPTDELKNPVVWMFQSAGMREAENARIKVETDSDFLFEFYKAFLARRLYSDSSRVLVKPLHGGYSAQTFQVESFDYAGRKLRPTVMKIANRAIITREADRCRKYSLPFILNNSAMVLGTEFYGDTGALRYNFVGIGGEQSRLKWLTHYFNTWRVSDLEPLFDKIFLQILKPWYGQPVREDIHPFLDHDPTLTFFNKLCNVAEEVLDISPEEPLMIVAETGEKRMNPYWFLKYEYLRRRGETMPYLTSVCHGDLNMQNILLDNEMNVYLIDFSETKPRSVVSDFARLEAIFMVEHAQMNESGDLNDLVAFTDEFYKTDRLDRFPEVRWTGINPEKMDRNIALTRKMREYALGCTAGDPGMIPYFMAMLEWVFPIVCYTGVPLPVKRMSAYIAGLLCEKLSVQ